MVATRPVYWVILGLFLGHVVSAQEEQRVVSAMHPLIGAAVTYSAWLLSLLIYSCSMATVGKISGWKPYKLSVGSGPKLFETTRRDINFVFRLFPLGSYVKFSDEDDCREFTMSGGVPEPKTKVDFRWRHPWRHLTILVSGSLALGLAGATIVLLSVQVNGPVIIQSPRDEGASVRPSAIGPIGLDDAPVAFIEELQYVNSQLVDLGVRWLGIRSLSDRGGMFGVCITVVAVGARSMHGWLLLIGALYVVTAIVNLLPVPFLNGFQVLRHRKEIT